MTLLFIRNETTDSIVVTRYSFLLLLFLVSIKRMLYYRFGGLRENWHTAPADKER